LPDLAAVGAAEGAVVGTTVLADTAAWVAAGSETSKVTLWLVLTGSQPTAATALGAALGVGTTAAGAAEATAVTATVTAGTAAGVETAVVGGSAFFGPLGVIGGLVVAGLIGGGIYLANRHSSPAPTTFSSGYSSAYAPSTPTSTDQPFPTDNSTPADATVPTDTPYPTDAPSPTQDLSQPFSQPQYLIHITGHATMDGPVADDAYILYPDEPDAQGNFTEGDGSGGVYHYASDYHSGPYQTPQSVCDGAGGRASGSLSAWDSNFTFTCP